MSDIINIDITNNVDNIVVDVTETAGGSTVQVTESVDVVDITTAVNVDEITIDVTDVVDEITINVTGGTGGVGVFNWNDYVTMYQPNGETNVTGGLVIQYDSDTQTIYRFVPEPYDYDTDAFYVNFDGTDLSNLITTRK